MRMWVVAFETEVLVLEVEDGLDIGVEFHHGQRTGLAGELQPGLLKMVQVEMGVASGVDEITRFIARHLCHHLEQQGVRGDVEWHAEEGVSRTLLELERETVASHVELEDGVARRQRHLIDFCHVPG